MIKVIKNNSDNIKLNINKRLINQVYNCINNNYIKKCGCQKTRGEKNFSKKKISQQKGTGRARLGNRSSPVLKGGGRAFPSKAIIKKKKINKKMYKECIKQCLLYKKKKRKIFLFKPEKKIKKTKDFVEELIKAGIYNSKILVIFKKKNKKEIKIINKIKNLIIDEFYKLNIKNIIKSKYIIYYNFLEL